ncbi:MAG TPA: hypothetical protein VIL85_28780 [Thermomicrobiales bacterium]|jgi:hypothetical protein
MMGTNDFGRSGSYGKTKSLNGGAVLIGFGVLFLLWQIMAPTGAIPLLILGSIFTGLALLKGLRGFVVPGSVLLGLAGGLIAAALLQHINDAWGSAAVVGGLGAGFWMMPLLDRIRNPYSNAFNWARIPGTILLAIAAFLGLIGTLGMAGRILGVLFQFWPVFLIVGGLWLFFGNRRRNRNSWS